MELLLTLFSGLFFLIGIIIHNITKHKKELTIASMSCAAVVIIGLIFGDLLPELLELKKWWIFLFSLLGLFLLVAIDKIVPHHHHDHHEHDEDGKEHQDHLEHIGVITIIALLLHNAIEGMALYGVAMDDIKSGVLMLIGIGLHNLPFGFQIANYNKDKKHSILLLLLITSGFIGGLIFFLFGSLNEIAEAIIIAVTLGMIIHILIFELIKEVIVNIKQKETIYGIIIGMIILILITQI